MVIAHARIASTCTLLQIRAKGKEREKARKDKEKAKEKAKAKEKIRTKQKKRSEQLGRTLRTTIHLRGEEDRRTKATIGIPATPGNRDHLLRKGGGTNLGDRDPVALIKERAKAKVIREKEKAGVSHRHVNQNAGNGTQVHVRTVTSANILTRFKYAGSS
jgi:hypothetical protein